MEMNTQEMVDKVRALFEELDKLTPDSIYERIKAAGLKGRSGHSWDCPLAVLAKHELGFAVMISMGNWRFDPGNGDWQYGLLPSSCVRFVRAIDSPHPNYADIIDDSPDPDDLDVIDDEEFTDYHSGYDL